MQSLERVIDKGAEICGGQNALARFLGIEKANLSAMRAGKRPIPDAKLEKLAKLVGIDPAQVWLIAQDARNPFRTKAAAVAAALALGTAARRRRGRACRRAPRRRRLPCPTCPAGSVPATQRA